MAKKKDPTDKIGTKTVTQTGEWKTYTWKELEEHIRLRRDVVRDCGLTIWEMETLIPMLEKEAEKRERTANKMLTILWHEIGMGEVKLLCSLASRLKARLAELYTQDEQLKP